ncbi:MAG: Methyltransferase type 12 [Bacteroidetes bacterium]|nr:Methyltransferase type 12 [Bacteroidota bacterium]
MKTPSTINTNKALYLNSTRIEMKKYIPEHAIKILEIGCSDGSFCSLIKKEERELWGVEMNKETALKAASVCDKVVIGNFDDVFNDLPKNYFDCIVFNDVLEHIYSPWNTLEMAKEILVDGGVVVSSIPNFRFIANMIEIVLHGEFRYRPEGGILDDTHIRFFTSKSIYQLFSNMGYKIVRSEGINSRNDWKIKFVKLLSLGTMKDMAYRQIATVAKLHKTEMIY